MTDKTYYMTNEQRKLAEENIDLVKFAINKYLCSMPLEFEDMVSIGYYGLCRAAIGFNPNKNHTFSTYAIRAIIRMIFREVDSYKMLKRGCMDRPISLNQTVGTDIENTELIDFVADKTVDVETEAVNKALCEKLLEMCPTYKGLVDNNMTLSQYGKMKGVSRQAVGLKKNIELRNARNYLIRSGITQSV